MDLQISVFLLFVLFTAGHSLNCQDCTGQTCGSVTCAAGLSNCFASTQELVNSNKVTAKSCAASSACPTGSVNLGTGRISSSCCNTDQCNAQDPPAPSTISNGKSCYFCDGKSCTNTVICSGTEDRCFKATVTLGSVSSAIRGCVSKSICDAPAAFPTVKDVTCCEGNLCNGDQSTTATATPSSAQSVSQSFLFLCCSLISYFLLQ